MKFTSLIKFVSISTAIVVIFYTLLVRFLSFFRNEIHIVVPFSNKILLILLVLNFILIFLLFFSVVKAKAAYSVFSLKISKILETLFKPFSDLHNFLASNTNIYGKFFTFINNFLIYVDIKPYDFFIILFFLSIPYSIVFTIFVCECLIYNTIFITFKLLPLLLLPIVGKFILFGTLSFLENNINIIENYLEFKKVEKSNNYFDDQFLSDLTETNQELFEIRSKSLDGRFSTLTTRELHSYYALLKNNQKNVQKINDLYSLFQKIFSVVRYIILVFLSTHFIYLNILYIYYN